MTLISTRLTFFLKRVFPLLWYGSVALVAWIGLVEQKGKSGAPPYLFLLAPGIMAVVAYFVIKYLVSKLADEVWDAGSELVVKNRGMEAHVPFSQIVNVSYERFINPPQVTLTLREPSVLGNEIVFSPPAVFKLFGRSPVVDDLIRRVDAARSR